MTFGPIFERIILIGYRCTGKTTVARKLARHLAWRMLDSDEEIGRKTGLTVAELFERHGEAGFRELERDTIAGILDDPSSGPLVLATGGGAILRDETRQKLRRAGHVVWLTASPETILRRLREDAATATLRPNLTELAPLEEIVALLERRGPFYRETAHRRLDTDKLSPDEIVAEILSAPARSGPDPDRPEG